jgi:hypothetical protein
MADILTGGTRPDAYFPNLARGFWLKQAVDVCHQLADDRLSF